MTPPRGPRPGGARWGVVAVAIVLTLAGCSQPGQEPGSVDVPATVYIDPDGGDDRADGSTPRTAWRTTANLHGRELVAGTTISIRRGTTLSEPFALVAAGTKEAPVVLTAYGDGGAPRWLLSDEAVDSCVSVAGRFAHVRDLHLAGCGWGGVAVEGTDVSVTDLETENSVNGVAVAPTAARTLVARNHIHDNNKMSVLTRVPATDDSGAFGVGVQGVHTIVSDNLIEECHADSYDFGTDGAGVEVYQAEDTQILRNRIRQCGAGIELGGDRTARTLIAYNIIETTTVRGARGIITRGHEEEFGPVLGTEIVNNTVLVNVEEGAGIVCAGECADPAVVSMRNNIVSAPDSIWGGGASEDYSVLWGRARTFVQGSHTVWLSDPWTDPDRLPPPALARGERTALVLDVHRRRVPSDQPPTIGAVQAPE